MFHATDVPLSTGHPDLDWVLDGGWKRQSVCQLRGSSQSGKTAIALATAQHTDLCIYMDFDPLGAISGHKAPTNTKFWLFSPYSKDIEANLGQKETDLARFLSSEMVREADLIVFDGLWSDTLSLVGALAGILCKVARNGPCILVLTPHLDPMETPFYIPGEASIALYARQRAEIHRKTILRQENGAFAGLECRFRCIKNTQAVPFREKIVTLNF